MTAAAPVIVLVALLGGVLLFGVPLVWRGWRGRRVGTTPYCARCGYVLMGITSSRCPECGADVSLPRAVVIGERRRDRRQVLAGLAMVAVLLVPLVAILVSAGRDFEWIRVTPAAWLVRDVRSADFGVASRAWGELVRRRNAGDLGESTARQLVALALEEEAATARAVDRALAAGQGPPPRRPILSDLIQYLGERRAAGKLSDEETKRFCDDLVQSRFYTRGTVVEGEGTPVSSQSYVLCPSTGWWVEMGIASVTRDGREVYRGSGDGSRVSGVGGSSGTSILLPATRPGDYVLTAGLRVRVYRGLFSNAAASRVESDRVIATTMPSRVVPQDAAAQAVKRIDRADEVIRMERSMAARLEPGQQTGFVHLTLNVTSLPENLAADVFVRTDGGRELPAGTISIRKGTSVNHGLVMPDTGELHAGKLDVVLRPSDAMARSTVDLNEMWGREIVLRATTTLRQAE